MSLDGYIAGPNDEPDNPGGDGFDRAARVDLDRRLDCPVRAGRARELGDRPIAGTSATEGSTGRGGQADGIGWATLALGFELQGR